MVVPAPQNPQSRPPQQAGGCLIAAGLIFGPIIGLAFGETSIGLLAGGAVGILAAVVMALRSR